MDTLNLVLINVMLIFIDEPKKIDAKFTTIEWSKKKKAVRLS